jgi:mannosyltransferase OCH1-like enzyme
MGLIPNVVYQTWKTKKLPGQVQAQIDIMKSLNPEYTFNLFDDTEMNSWMEENVPADVLSAYKSLQVGAAKADLWRYCILFKMGGIYLDIDSIILSPIHLFVESTDQAVISRESNVGCFLQWLLAFQKGHPILETAIEIATQNILNKSSTNVAILTGPHVFTQAVNKIMHPYYSIYTNLWYQSDEDLNTELNTTSPIRCKFIGTDFQDHKNKRLYALWKMPGADEFYIDNKHWVGDTRVFKGDT